MSMDHHCQLHHYDDSHKQSYSLDHVHYTMLRATQGYYSFFDKYANLAFEDICKIYQNSDHYPNILEPFYANHHYMIPNQRLDSFVMYYFLL